MSVHTFKKVRPDARGSTDCAELIKIMSAQEKICLRLLDLADQERLAVLEGRVHDLEIATRQKDGLVEEMERLEQRRRTVARVVCAALSLSPDTSLLELAEAIEGEDSTRLIELRQRVMDTVARLRESNESNLLLMRKSLDLVRESIRQLRRSMGTGEVYTSDGRQPVAATNTVMVDCRA